MSLKTGKTLQVGHAFHRRLLSEYNPHYTLDNYVKYFELKDIIAEIEVLQKKEIKQRRLLDAASPIYSRAGSLRLDSQSGNKDITADNEERDQTAGITIDAEDLDGRVLALVSPDTGLPCSGKMLIPERAKLEELAERIEEKIGHFFELLKSSFIHVRSFLTAKEWEAEQQVLRIIGTPEARLREEQSHQDTIAIVYRRVRYVALYREINILGFQKILLKFLSHCASENLELQKKAYAADSIIANSSLCKPRIDCDHLAEKLVTVYAIVNSNAQKPMMFEKAKKCLDLFVERDVISTERIPPLTNAFFYFRNFSHRQSQGSFSLKLVQGSTSKFLTKKMAQTIQCDPTDTDSSLFANGEIKVRIGEAVRGDDVFVIQSMVGTSKQSMSSSIMELALTIQTLSLASAARITAVIPYISYCRSPNAMAAVAEILMVNGCKQVLTVDLMKDQVEGMFGNLPVYNITATMEFIHYISQRLRVEEADVTNLVVVSPDADTVARAHAFADALTKHLNDVLFGKTRKLTGTTAPTPIYEEGAKAMHGIPHSDKIRVMSPVTKHEQYAIPVVPPTAAVTLPHTKDTQQPDILIPIATALKRFYDGAHSIDVVGEVKDKVCIIVDTLLDEAVNAFEVAKTLKAQGAKKVIVIATHALFSNKALDLIATPNVFDEIIVSDSVDNDYCMKRLDVAKKLRIISVAPLLALAVQKMHTDNCLSTLFDR